MTLINFKFINFLDSIASLQNDNFQIYKPSLLCQNGSLSPVTLERIPIKSGEVIGSILDSIAAPRQTRLAPE